jgi:hypothetical protein
MRAGPHASWRSLRAPLRQRKPRWVAISAFIGASVALHVLMLSALVRGDIGRSRIVHSREGMGANATGSPDEAITTMFFVEDSSAAEKSDLEELASAGKVLESLRVTIVSPDSSIDAALQDASKDDHSTSDDGTSLGEREARAALFGRYVGQIEARIDRAWMRPRTAIGADLFECRVRVQQNAQRMVTEVTLQDCNGDMYWQLSLVSAIQSASPLSAPPDPSVFASTLDLHFSSLAYAPGRNEQGYEPSTIAALNNTNRSP